MYLTKKCVHKNKVYKGVLSSFIHYNPKLEKKNTNNLQHILHILFIWEDIEGFCYPVSVLDSNNVLHLYRTLKLQISHTSHS